ncbi:MAG: DUF2892 domain-containing protein [Gammaproteobacteria bacterium]|nr:DUF2892 domain-containing protein [Gammaproteobacteria bacterium]
MTNNLSAFDQTVRLISGAVIIGAVLAQPQLPAWLALLATYPVFTALINWDPFYALIKALKGDFDDTTMLPNGASKASV